jgi:hypothetical protein
MLSETNKNCAIAQQEGASATADGVVHWEIPGEAGTVVGQKATP